MPERTNARCRPSLEGLEGRRLPSAAAAHAAMPRRVAAFAPLRATPAEAKPDHGYLLYRITNPNRFNQAPKPPFQHVMVQREQPVRGQEYNVLSVLVRNAAARTFDADDGLEVKLSQQDYETPILVGNQQWKPGEWFVFYVLTKKYYPVPSQVKSGFVFNLDGARSIAIPGPSGIFQRLTYAPDRFDRQLDWIVTQGPGTQGGRGFKYGLPVTNINEFVSARTNRMDFGGYF